MFGDVTVRQVLDFLRLLEVTQGPQEPSEPLSERFQIVVLDRGFVYVGRVSHEDGFIVIHDARNIRKWGTTQGLGQLATDGPQPNTELDTVGTVRAPARALISLIDTEANRWTQS